jgi:hypothetical protein
MICDIPDMVKTPLVLHVIELVGEQLRSRGFSNPRTAVATRRHRAARDGAHRNEDSGRARGCANTVFLRDFPGVFCRRLR